MSIDSIVRTCNKQAMEYLCTNNYTECYRLLKKAEEIINSPSYPTNSKLHAVTLNNLGCYYKRISSFDLALSYLQKALAEEKDSDLSATAGTHLNILAVYSQKNNHQEALHHGIQALKLLKDTSNLDTLSIALQNTGDEYIALGNNEKALATYKYGLELCQKNFGDSHEYTITFYNKYHSLSQPEKKFYFEKLNKRTTKQIFTNFRNYSILPHVNGPIRPSKSVEKNPPPKQKFSSRNMRSDRIYMKTAPNKTKSYSVNREKVRTNQGKMYTLDDTYMKLEEKINSLQNQLENFEARYKNLENFAKNKSQTKKIKKIRKNTPVECAIMIQK